MKHPNADPEYRFSQLLDDDLPSNEARALRADLARDADLRDAHETYARVDALVREAAGPLPDVDWPAFAATVSSAIDADVRRRNDRRIRRWQFGCVAAAAVAMFMLLRPAPLPDGPGPNPVVAGVQVAFADGNPMPAPSAAHPSGVTVEFFAAATPPRPSPTRRAVLIVTIGRAPPVGESGPEPAREDML